MVIKMSLKTFLYLMIFVCVGVQCFPEKGRWVYDINENTEFVGVSKSMFAGTKISVHSNYTFLIRQCICQIS